MLYARLQQRITDALAIPIRDMGFPENWQECPIWAGTGASKPKGGQA